MPENEEEKEKKDLFEVGKFKFDAFGESEESEVEVKEEPKPEEKSKEVVEQVPTEQKKPGKDYQVPVREIEVEELEKLDKHPISQPIETTQIEKKPVEPEVEEQIGEATIIEPNDKGKETDTGLEEIEAQIAEVMEGIKGRREKQQDRTLFDTGEIVWTRGGEEHGGKAYALGVRDGFLSRDKEERERAILEVIMSRNDTPEVKEKLRKMFDISNQKEAVIDEEGFEKLPGDENNKRFLLVYREGDETARPHFRDVTAYNTLILTKAVDEIDLTPGYVDKKAFWDLVDEIGLDKARELVKDWKEVDREKFERLVERMIDEVGTREAIQRVLNSPGMLGQNKRDIKKRIKSGFESFRGGYSTGFEMRRFIWNQENLDLNEDYFDEGRGITKMSINPISKASDAELELRARSNAIDRIVHRFKVNRLYTAKTTGGRDSIKMREYITPKLGEFLEKIDEIRRKLGELEEGETGGLESLLERGALSTSELLSYVHRLGIRHRDLKPENLFLGKDGYVHVADFSIGKAAEQRSDLTQLDVIGSPIYMSQAQAWAANTDDRDDIYSFGRTLTAIIVNEPPYKGEANTIINMIRNGVRPFGIGHSVHKEKLYEDLGMDKWYSKLNPFNLVKLWRRYKLNRRLNRVLARCSQMGSENDNYGRDRIYNSCQEVHEDIESVLKGKKPEHVNGYLKKTGMSERELLEGAYELRDIQMGEEAKRVKRETHSFYKKLLPAVVLGSILTWEGCKFGYKTIRDAWEYIHQDSEQVDK